MKRTSKPQSHLSKFDERLRKVAQLGVFLTLLTPLFFLPNVWHPYTSGKAWLFQSVIALTFPAWVLLAVRQPAFRPKRTMLFWALVAQSGAMLLSVVFARDPHVAFFGSTDKMDGLLTWAHLTAFFLMAQSLWQSGHDTRWALKVTLGVGAVTAFLALVQRAVPDLLGTQADIRASGTLGNPVFLGAYLSTLSMLALYWTSTQTALRKVAFCVGSLSVVVLFLTGSRGALLGLAMSLASAWVGYILFTRNRRWLWGLVVLSLLSALAYGAMSRYGVSHPSLASFFEKNPNLRRLFELKDIGDRFHIWKVTGPGLAEHPLFGWGQANYEYLFDAHYLPREGCAPVGLNDPHNLVLNLLSTQGAVGLLAFLLLLGSSLSTLHRTWRAGKVNPAQAALLSGTLLGMWVPFLFNPESLSNTFLAFFLLALIERLSPDTPRVFINSRPLSPWALPVATATGTLLAIGISLLPAWASSDAVRALQAYGRQETDTATQAFEAALSRPTPYLEEQLAIGTQMLVKKAETNRLGDWRPLFDSVRELWARYSRHHQRLHFRLSWLLVLSKVGQTTRDETMLDEAERGFRLWLVEQPRRQAVLYAFGDHLAARGKLDEAQAVFQRALDLDRTIGEASFRLGAFLWQYRKEAEQGSRLILESTRAQCLFLGYNMTQASQVAQGLFRQGDVEGLRAAVPRVVADIPGPTERSYLLFAQYLEQARLHAERDQVLRTAIRRMPALAPTLRPVWEGKKTVAQLNAERN